MDQTADCSGSKFWIILIGRHLLLLEKCQKSKSTELMFFDANSVYPIDI